MQINKDHLNLIYETLANQITSNEVVSHFLLKFPVATKFHYSGDKVYFSSLYYLVPPDYDTGTKVIDLADISTQSEFLDTVLKDAEFLFSKAKEERQTLDSYISRIKSL